MPPESVSGSNSTASRRRVIVQRRDPRRPTMRWGIVSSFPRPGGSRAAGRKSQLLLGAEPPAGGSTPGNDDLLGVGLERQLTALQIHLDTIDRFAMLIDEDLRHRVL